MKYTPEPWSSYQSVIAPGEIHIGTPARTCAVVHYDYPDQVVAQANAARIIACVNACTGIADPAQAIASARTALALASEWLNVAIGDEPEDYRNDHLRVTANKVETAIKHLTKLSN